MDRFAMLFLAGLGLACICAGYQLFCGLPAMTGPRPRVSPASVLLLNIIPGALLALIGAGILTAETHSIVSHKHVVPHRRSAGEGVSWHPGKAGFPAHSA